MDSAQLVEFFFEEINKIRKSPVSLQPLLNDRILRLVNEGQKQRQPRCYSHYEFGNVLFKTNQGRRAIQQALDYVRQQPRVRGLILSQKLCQAAYQIGLQMQKYLPRQIDLSAYKEVVKAQIKNLLPEQTSLRFQPLIEYGFRKDMDLLPTIVIDDGNSERTRRNTLMNEYWTSVGISVHQHNEFDYFVLFLFSTYDEPIGCRCSIM